MLQAGESFPAFSLPNQNGKTVKLADYAGKWLVVYFYPKDDTPGCTMQGKSFTATKGDFDAAGITVLGVSANDVTSHKNFHHKFAFRIDLLSDLNHALLEACGVGRSGYNGMMYRERASVVSISKGVVCKWYAKVNPHGHEKVLLAE